MSMAPPPPYYVLVMDDLRKGQNFAAQLQGLLRDSPKAGLIVDQILHTFSRVIRAIDAAAAGAGEGSEVQCEVTCGGGKRKAAAAGGGGDRRGACRRRTQQSSGNTLTMKNLDDGQAWRKYGQKEIHNSKYPKAYFRCTHKFDQHCTALRQVQRCDEDPDAFRVTYIGEHTCRDPAAVAPQVIHQIAAAAAEGLHAGSRLISFAPAAAAAAAAATPATTTSTTTTNTNLADKGAAPGSGLHSLKMEGGDQEEVLSSRTPGSSAAPTAAVAWPDQGDVTSTLHCYGDGGADDMGVFFEDYMDHLADIVPDLFR